MKNNSVYKKRETAVLSYVSILLTAACIVTGIFCLDNIRNEWIRSHFLICAIAYSCVMTILCAASILCLFFDKKTITKSLLSVLILILFALIVWLLLQKTGFFYVIADAKRLQEYL